MFYAVRKGIQPGIYNNWSECEKQIKGFKGSQFKKFASIIDAKEFIKSGNVERKTLYLDNFFPIKITENPNKMNYINVYTDGSCYGNGSKIAYGGYGAYFGENDVRNFSLPTISDIPTNNIAELMAILHVFEILNKEIIDNIPIMIFTDSEYSIKCFTTYGEKLYKNMWKSNNNKSIPNLELIKKGYNIVKLHPTIKFKHILAHTRKKDIHSLSNDKADTLAKRGMFKSIDMSNNIGLNKFKKGQYKNKTLNYVLNIDKNYINWYYKTKPYTREETFLYILGKFIYIISK